MAAQDSGISASKIREIWAKLTVDDWLNVLNEFYPDNEWAPRGDSIRGKCPFHSPDNTPSFFININRCGYICYSTNCQKSGWDPIRLFSELAKTSYADATKELKNRFNIRLPNTFVQNAQRIEDHNTMKLALLSVMNAELVDALEHPDAEEYQYLKKTLQWLSERKFPGTLGACQGAVHLWPVGVLPPQPRLHDRLQTKSQWASLYEAAYTYLIDYIGSENFLGSLALFFFTTPTTVGRIRLRIPGTKKFYAVTDQYDEDVGLFGLNAISYLHQQEEIKRRRVVAVEGEFDQLAIYSHQVARGEDDIIPIALGGGLNQDLSKLAVFGIDRVSLLQDKDAAGEGFAKRLIREGHVADIFCWTLADYETPQYKDIDGAIRFHGYDMMHERLVSADSYLRPHEWAQTLLTRELKKIPLADVRERMTKAGEFGAFLQDPAERDLYVDATADQLGLSRKSVLRSMPLELETPGDLATWFERRLLQEYCVLYAGTGRSDKLVLWNRKKRAERELSHTSRQNICGLLKFDLGDLQQLVEDECGIPDCIAFRPGPKGPVAVPDNKVNQAIEQAVIRAMGNIAKEAPMQDLMHSLGQGVHYIPDFDRGQPAVLIANGTQFFLGRIHNDKISYELLESPMIRNYYFKTNHKTWSDFINTPEDLKPDQVASYSLRESLQGIHKIINKAWLFQHHDVDPWFLAAEAVYTTVASVFGHMTMTEISGETQSGKTKLGEFIGGRDLTIRDSRLCEATDSVDNYSSAALRQLHTDSPLRIILDEFEAEQGNYDVDRNRKIQTILSDIRRLSTGSEIIRGTSDGTAPKRYRLHCPLTVIGIHATKIACDVNRFVKVGLIQRKGFPDPYATIRQMLSLEEAVRLRRNITLGLLQQIPQLVDTYRAIKLEFAHNVGLPPGLDTRLKDNLLPSATLLKMAGLHYKEYLAQMCKYKMTYLEKVGATKREFETLWHEVLHTPIMLNQHCPDRIGQMSIARMVNDPGAHSVLNALTDLGAYYLPELNWLVVFWTPLAKTVLKNSNNFRFMVDNPGQLKSIAEMDARTIKQNILESSNFLPRAGRLTGTKITYDDISVFDASTILNEEIRQPGFSSELTPGRSVGVVDDNVSADDLRGNFDELPDGVKKA